MTDLTADLNALVSRYAAKWDSGPPRADLDRLTEEFSREMDLLIGQYGQTAVDRAIDAMADPQWPSVSLH